MARALAFVSEQGMALIDPIDDPAIIAGQGTIGLEIAADLPEVGTVLVPLSGGGLFSGVALALRVVRPQVRLVGGRCQAIAVRRCA